MRKLVVMFVVLSLSSVAIGAVSEKSKEDKGRETINLKMADAVLAFQHWKHQNILKKECFHCHNTKIGTIDGWGKDAAHKICIPCHDLEEKGPVSCKECHTKFVK